MKKSSKVFCLLFTVLMIFTLSVTAFAVNETNDGNIKIEVATDKDSYKAWGVAEITATITNVSSEDIDNVTAQAVFNDLAPAGKRSSETSKSVDVLKSGESFSFTYKATLDKNEHDLNIFQKIILWFVRLFNGGYTANNNSIDVVAENVTEITFGKFTAENVVQVGYEYNDSGNNDNDNNNDDNNNSNDSDDNISDIPTYEELIENVDIDEIYDYDESDVSIDDESGLTYINNIIILMFDDDCTNSEKAEAINSINGKVVGGNATYNELYIEIKESTISELYSICEKLSENYRLDAFFDTAVYTTNDSVSYSPNDTYLIDSTDIVAKNFNSNNLSWYAYDITTFNYRNWYHLAVQTPKAWKYCDYFNNINIGIIDNGFSTGHNDLDINIVSEKNDISNHGTHVAGIIGAISNNGVGSAGIVPNSNLYGYSIGDSDFDNIKQNIFRTETFNGLEKLVENNCKVINVSLSTGIGLSNSNKEYIDTTINIWGKEASKKIAKLLKKDKEFIVVQAAGNGAKDKLGVNAENSGLFSAITTDNCYSDKSVSVDDIMNRVIIVANATINNKNYQLTEDSNGGNQVDIAAPGENIYSTVAGVYEIDDNGDVLVNQNQQYAIKSGTSMAAPIVAGVAGLVWSVNENFTGAQVKEMICRTAEEGGILVKDNSYSPTTGSFYLVNAKLAVEEAIKKTYWTCTVKGNVIDQNDESISNVNIVATDMDTNKKVVAQNNSDGTFSLLLPCGTYSISLSKYATEVVIELDKTTYNQEIDLGEILMIIPKSTVSGTVKDRDSNEPVSNVAIDVYNTESEEYCDGATTDENGCFEMEIPRDDSFIFTFYHADYEEPYTMEVNAKTDPVNLGDIFISKDGYEYDNKEEIDSGTCGTNVTWTLYDDGELVISGSGETNKYKDNFSDEDLPYSPFYNNDNIKKVTIKSGITSIGNYLFWSCEYLEDVIIPDTVTNIGEGAFEKCSSLNNISLGNNVINIGDYAFYQCTNLENIILPESVNNIGKAAFRYCESLKNIVIPKKVTNIETGMFLDCISLTNVQISDGVTSIEEQAFANCESLTSINGANNVNTIGSSVLMNSTGYYENQDNWQDGVLYLGSAVVDNDNETTKDIVVKDDTLCIAPYAFSENSFTKIVLPEGLLYIGDRAFFDSDSLTQIEIPETVKAIYGNAFESCGSLTNIVFPDGVEIIGDIDFSWCHELEGIILPETVTNISYGAFECCYNLKSVVLPNTIKTIEYDAFYQCSSLENIVIPNGVTSIGESAFEQCRALTDITIPDSVTSIGANAFEQCYGLTEITLPNNLKVLEDSIFESCSYLKSIKIPENLTTINNKAFYSCYDLTDITIPKSVTYIGDQAFMYCDNLISITIPENVTTIGIKAFCSCDNLSEIVVDASNSNYSSDNFGVLYNKNKTSLIQFPIGNSSLNYSIPNSVLTIEDYAFYGKSFYNEPDIIIIPENVARIGNYAFGSCFYLNKYEILNPDCEIYDSSNTLFYLIDSNSTIYGYANSTAQAYAEKYDITFVALD